MSKGFYKQSRTSILSFRDNSESSFSKSAGRTKTASHFENEGIKIDVQASLDTVADTYRISKNPDDYVYVISRALTADVPNENHDNFPSEELLRFDAAAGCRVFQTFINKPNHINHRADDPTQARGVILDAHYNDINPDDQFVEILVAVDKTKDKKLAESIQKNEVNSMSMGCTRAGTPILMGDGNFKNIEDIEVGDDVITHTGKTNKVKYFMFRPHKGDIYHLKVDNIQKELVFTEEHPFWIFDPETKTFDWKDAKDLSVGDYVTYPANSFDSRKSATTLDIKRARLLGYYLAEGWVLDSKKRNGIGFTIHKDETVMRDEICSLIEDITGKKAKYTPHSTCANAVNIKIYDKALCEDLTSLGGQYSKKKELSKKVMRWSTEEKGQMLGAYFNGDGHQAQGTRKGRIYLSTASEVLAKQVRLLLLEFGIHNHLYEHIRKPTPNGFSKEENTQYQITIGKNEVNKFMDLTSFDGFHCEAAHKGRQNKIFHDDYWCSPITDITLKPYDDMVFNFEVDGDHSYIAEGIAVHNCYAELCICSVCGHEAESTEDLCPDHIRGGKKGKEFNGSKSFENCHKVSFNEESWVDEPADPQALVSEVMKIKASIDAVTEAKNVGYESEIFILNTKLAKIEKMILGLTSKTASKQADTENGGGVQEAAAEMADEIQKVQDYLDKLAKDVDGGAITYEDYLEKVKDLPKALASDDVEDTDSDDADEDNEIFNDDNTENKEENKMAGTNPYAKLADMKKESKGGGNPKDFTGIDSGKGNPPKEWAKPGKGDGAAPSDWKFASKKVALDEKAKKYWSEYYQNYGQALIKDLKRKKIGSNETISFDQMRLLDPKLASVMKELEIGSLKVSTIFKLAEDIGIVAESFKDDSKEKGGNAPKEWSSIDAAVKTGSNVTLDLLGDAWHLREADNSLIVIDNVDGLTEDEFSSDTFASEIIASLREDGAEKTAEKYKVALYDATNPPSIVEESNDDMRGDVKKKPTVGVEEGGIDDLDGIDKSEVKDKDGVAEGVELDMKTSSIEKEAIGVNYAEILLKNIIAAVNPQESPGARKIVERVTADPSFIDKIQKVVQAIEADAKTQVKSEEITPKEMQSASVIAEKLSAFILSAYKEALDVAETEEAAIASVIETVAEFEYDTPLEEVKADSDAEGAQEAEVAPEAKEEEDEKEEDDKEAAKEAGVLDDAENDLDGEGMTEQTKGITEDGSGDLAGVNKESYPDKIYEEGQDDLAGDKGTVIKISAKEKEEFKKVHASRFNRALKLAIKRSNLNLISNELKAALHDALTSECALPDGDEYTAMDDGLSKYLIESAFEVGASQYFDDMLKESEKLLTLPEDALLAIEADIQDLQMVDPAIHTPSSYEEYEEDVTEASAKADEALAGNPVFKASAATESAGRHTGLRGAFGEANITDAMRNKKG